MLAPRPWVTVLPIASSWTRFTNVDLDRFALSGPELGDDCFEEVTDRRFLVLQMKVGLGA